MAGTVKDKKKRTEVLLFLLIISLIGAFIEFTYGSVYVGVVFFCICLVLLFVLSGERPKEARASKSLIFVFMGAILIVADLTYNYLSGSAILTLDQMVILLGVSLMLASSNNKRLCELGTFSMYMSLFFLIFFVALYIIPSKLNIGIPHYYGHYFVALPVCGFLKMLGLDLEVPEIGIIVVKGIELTSLKMDLACFGWYSMLLIISTLLAYNIVMEHYERHKLLNILLVLVGASYVANFLRVSILVALAYYYNIETMMLFHSHLGWVLFAIILIPLMYVFFLKQEQRGDERV